MQALTLIYVYMYIDTYVRMEMPRKFCLLSYKENCAVIPKTQKS